MLATKFKHTTQKQVTGPLLYSQLYVRGKAAGVPSAPFIFSAVLTAAALVYGDAILRCGDTLQGGGPD